MTQLSGKILLTFDVEEFDLPLEYGHRVAPEEQLETGFSGLEAIAGILDTPSVTTTLFTTAVFAEYYPREIRALSDKHEIASHSYSHTRYVEGDILRSKEYLEILTGKKIRGLRMPRMQKVNPKLVSQAGYMYHSNINPTWLPGRYNNLSAPRLPYREGGLMQFPVSVSPHLRIPLFWLAFKTMPYRLYLRLVLQTLRRDHVVCLYFHPWEFADLSASRVPYYIRRRSGNELLRRMKRLVADLSKEGEFVTMDRYMQENFLEKSDCKNIHSVLV
jgi:hypothetical protein